MKTFACAISLVKSTAFFKYLIAMLESILQNGGTKYPLVIFYDYLADIYRDSIKKIWNDVDFQQIDVEKYYKYKKSAPGWYCLEAFNLKGYDRVVNIDIDFICLDNIQALFERPVDYIGMVREKTGIFNGGLTVIDEKVLNSSAYTDLLTCDHETVELPGSNRNDYSKDQKLYNWYFDGKITEFDRKYNFLISDIEHQEDIRLLHYIYKPFYKTGRKQLQELSEGHDIDLLGIFEKYYNQAKEKIL